MIEKIESKITAERAAVYAFFFAASIWAVYGVALYLSYDSGGVNEQGVAIGNDFLAFWSAADLAASGDAAAAYDADSLQIRQQERFPTFMSVLPWLYPPHYLLMVRPLASLDYFWALGVFLTASVAAYVFALRKILPFGQAWVPIIGFPGLLAALLFGQNTTFVTLLLGLFLLNLNARPILAGVFLGALTIKPHFGVLIPLALALTGQWRCFMSAGLTTLTLLTVSVQILGFETLVAFPLAVMSMQTYMLDGSAAMTHMVTLYAQLLRLEFAPAFAGLLHGVVALVAATTALRIWRLPVSANVRYASLVTGTFLVSPYLLRYDLVVIALPIAFMVLDGIRSGWLIGEKSILVLAWMLPAFSHFGFLSPLVPVVPLMLGVLMLAIHTRAQHQYSLTFAIQRSNSAP